MSILPPLELPPFPIFVDPNVPVVPPNGNKSWGVFSTLSYLVTKIYNAICYIFGFSTQNDELKIIPILDLPPPPPVRMTMEEMTEHVRQQALLKGINPSPMPINFTGRQQLQNFGPSSFSPVHAARDRDNDKNNICALEKERQHVMVVLPENFDVNALSKPMHKRVARELAHFAAEINRSRGDRFEEKKLPIAERNHVFEVLKNYTAAFGEMRQEVVSLTNDKQNLDSLRNQITDVLRSSPSVAETSELTRLHQDAKVIYERRSTEIRDCNTEIARLLNSHRANATLADIAIPNPTLYAQIFATKQHKESLEDQLSKKLGAEVKVLKDVLKAMPLILEKAEDTSELTQLKYNRIQKEKIDAVYLPDLETLDGEIAEEDDAEDLNELRDEKAALETEYRQKIAPFVAKIREYQWLLGLPVTGM